MDQMQIDVQDGRTIGLLRNHMGYERGYIELHEHPRRLHSLLEVATETDRRLWPVVLDSPAVMIRYGSHFDGRTLPPPIFERFPITLQFRIVADPSPVPGNEESYFM